MQVGPTRRGAPRVGFVVEGAGAQEGFEAGVQHFFAEHGIGDGEPQEVVVRPRVEIREPDGADPGLTRIAMAYGYMCAADVIATRERHRGRAARLADDICLLRRRLWSSEGAAAQVELEPGTGAVRAADPQALRDVRALKRQLRDLVASRREIGAPIPDDAATWWQRWERHTWEPFTRTPWEAFASRRGAVPAAPPPPSLPRLALTVPAPLEPADRSLLGNVPRAVTLRWLPVDHATRYGVNVEFFDPVSGEWIRTTGGIVHAPPFACTFAGPCKARWNVHAFDHRHMSEPSPPSAWVHFEFTG